MARRATNDEVNVPLLEGEADDAEDAEQDLERDEVIISTDPAPTTAAPYPYQPSYPTPAVAADGNAQERASLAQRINAAAETGQKDVAGVPKEAPPAYSVMSWKESRAVGSNLPASTQERLSSYDDPFANMPEGQGPRSVRIRRTPQGFGFTIGGSRPCCAMTVAAAGVAAERGLKTGDQILEINGVDVTEASLADVSSKIQLADDILTLIVVPGVDGAQHRTSWDRALMGLENEPGQFGPVELDPTQPPPTHLRQAAASSLCCPLIGCAAVWHSLQVSHAWGQGHHNRARIHSIMSRKLAGSAVFYGIVIIVMYFFCH